MANILPEVQPVVTSMPDRGYDLQTGGSARRSFIKNTDNTYFIHGVPGHTHNSSAMISVTAEYTRTRGIARTINTSWANDPVVMAAEDYTDSIEPRDKEERYDRAIERGIGRIIMIPENTNHIIEEPVRSISEIRTIVSPKDQLKSLTYISNVHGDGWVDPVTGSAGSFNRDNSVNINFYSYGGVPELETDANNQGTMRQPVYIANPNVNTIRYAITGAGSYDAAGNELWDGNVPFYWDEDDRNYYSKKFTMYFPAYELPSVVNAQNTALEPTGAGQPIPRANFQVEFASYETSSAEDGFCVFSEQKALIVSTSTASTGQELIARIPVQVVFADIKMFSLAYWYGPPAFRIPVGGTHAIPGPPRRQANHYPSTYDDRNSNTQDGCLPFYQILNLTNEFQQARHYDGVFSSRINAMKTGDFPAKQVGSNNDATNQAALKVIAWEDYLRPFGYGEAKNTLTRTSRHGFSSMFKFENSPYLGLNGLWAPDVYIDEDGISNYTSDGVIPYPFIQPELTANGTDVTVAWVAASYQGGQNINRLFNLFPEEELYQIRVETGTLPADGPTAWKDHHIDVRKAFYEPWRMTMTWNSDVVWQVWMPIDTSTNLFMFPTAGPVNPWDQGPGGSVSYRDYVFTRLYRTFLQLKTDPSNILDVGIKAAAQAELLDEAQRTNRVGAPAVYINFKSGAHRMQTFPFRILCHGHGSNVANESHYVSFRSGIETVRDSASTMQADLEDTSGNNVGAIDWEIESIYSVERRLVATQEQNVGVYPFTEYKHPKYAPFLHNAIGNLFEIRDFSATATHVILRDIYWEPSEFVNSKGRPNIILVFNNYGLTYGAQRKPFAYSMFRNDGVRGMYDRVQAGTGPTANDQQLGQPNGPLGDAALTGLNRVSMYIPLDNFVRFDDAEDEIALTKATFDAYVTQMPAGLPKLAIFVPGETHSERFHNKNFEIIREASAVRGKVFRSDVKISQHLCSPVLNPDMRLQCIAPLNFASRHLPQLLLRDVDFKFLKATSTPVLGDIVLSEFNGGIQEVAVQESLLYLPNFIEFTTSVQDDMTFEVDCMTGKGVPGYLCVFCRDSDDVLEQPIIKRLSLRNLTTMKKSDSVTDTDVHELYHMTQRNVHPRSEYDSKAFNRRQTLLLAIEDIGIMGMEAKHYQRQKRIKIRVSGLCTNDGTVTVIFIYNNRGLFVKGRQQSVVHM